jgi:cytochrome c oxidase subunit 1
MPRRISDYPDLFYLWNHVSSFGAHVSLYGAGCFIVILFEALWYQRALLGNSLPSSNLEWNSSYPSDWHTATQSIKTAKIDK